MVQSTFANEVIGQLEDAQDVGFSYVVFELYEDQRTMQPHHFQVFDTYGAALEHRQLKAAGQDERTVHCWPIDRLLEALQNPNSLNNTAAMNLNNLQNLKDEVKDLRFHDKVVPEMEANMQKNLPDFQLHDSRPGNRSVVDFTLFFKKSSQSDFYYLNKYNVYLNRTQPLAEGQKYLVMAKGDNDKPVFRSFQNPHEAIEHFKNQQGNAELAVGKDPGNKMTLANMENSKVNYVEKEFQKTYYAPPITHTVYVEQGRGFTAEQTANMIEGRSVYRDDLINMGGQPYKAWVMFDMEKGKDRNNNFQTRHFTEGYGFNLNEALKDFNIKELTDPAKTEKLEESLRNGNRPLITTTLEGKETKLHIEAVPRYGKINFYQENGKPEKREQFELKKTGADLSNGKADKKELAESRGVRM
jgi:hypothetical protein